MVSNIGKSNRWKPGTKILKPFFGTGYAAMSTLQVNNHVHCISPDFGTTKIIHLLSFLLTY